MPRKKVRENEKLKRKNKELAHAAKEQSAHKKPRKASNALWEVVKNDERALYFSQQTKTVKHRHKKFLANDQELEEMVLDIAKRSSLKKELALLNPNDQQEMGRRLSKVYGPQCARDLNAKRSSMQQAAKTAFNECLDEGTPITGKQLRYVVQRQGIFLHDEDVSDNEQANKNKALNVKNQRWRDIFDLFNDKFIGNCLGQKVWSAETRSLKTISSLDGVTVSDEAMIVILVLNAEKKWLEQYKINKAGGKEPPRDALRKYVLYSDDAGGSCRFGGWHKPGRLLFKEIRSQIKKGRSLETTKLAEEQCRDRLFVKHDMEKKLASRKRKPKAKQPKVDLVGAAIGHGDDDSDCEFEGYESDDEANREMLAAAMAPAAAAAPQRGSI